jgi:hypothetical protein
MRNRSVGCGVMPCTLPRLARACRTATAASISTRRSATGSASQSRVFRPGWTSPTLPVCVSWLRGRATPRGERCERYIRDIFGLGLVGCHSCVWHVPHGCRSCELGGQCRWSQPPLAQFMDRRRQRFSRVRWGRSAIAYDSGAGAGAAHSAENWISGLTLPRPIRAFGMSPVDNKLHHTCD